MAPYTRNNVYIVLIDGKKLPNRFSDNNFNNGDETCPTGLMVDIPDGRVLIKSTIVLCKRCKDTFSIGGLTSILVLKEREMVNEDADMSLENNNELPTMKINGLIVLQRRRIVNDSFCMDFVNF
ncbi:hypothetical protein OUZ56_015103 [Daphnia magna]|uniref:Uncharacterized protein n=1 Tax=Daphnia magna TaxID=35525 RepID=A0ABR0ALV1_9CRUS|nr:hypothetical protein OUZ56_015103 [Daphnia magna]